MKALIKIVDPDKVEMSLTLTMTLGAWEILQNQVEGKWPGWQVKAVIDDMIAKAQKQFTSQDEIEK